MKLSLETQTTGLVTSRLKEALGSSKLVVCLGSRLELASFCYVDAIKDNVVGGATTTTEAKELLNETFADFLICDDVPEAGSGLALAKEFRHLKTLVLTSRENGELVKEAEDAGVDGLVFRSGIGLAGEGSFLQAISTVARGGVWLSPAVGCIVDGGNGVDKEALATISELTDKERGVLTQVGRGLDNSEIAAELFISEETCRAICAASKVGETDRGNWPRHPRRHLAPIFFYTTFEKTRKNQKKAKVVGNKWERVHPCPAIVRIGMSIR